VFLKELAKELHKPVRHKFPTKRVFADAKDATWGIDLADMGTWKAENESYTFILTVIDVYTRWADARPLKTKGADEVLKALQSICDESKRLPRALWADEGKEFDNAKMKTWRDKHNIEPYHTYGPHKSVIVERFNRTLKTNMWTQLTALNTHEWVPLLAELIANYNSNTHRTMKMTPDDASLHPEKVAAVWAEQKSEVAKEPRRALFAVGDWVRLSRVKGTFEKGYDEKWTREIYQVTQVLATTPITYLLKEYDGAPLSASFYNEELQKVKYPDTFLIENVIKERGKGVKRELFVKWSGYNAKSNSWVKANDTKKL
jgi:hypothetical protein